MPPSHLETNRILPAWKCHPRAWAIGTILLATVLAYANSFSGPFLYDDVQSIPENRSIRHLDEFTEVFSPPLSNGPTVGNRPLLDFSLAINYALGGYRVWGYHAGNLLIHLLAALTLFGLVRRTFLQPVLRDTYGRDATLLGWAVTILWAVHPLQTESVTYLIQRAESLAGLFFLLTLYAFVRATQTDRPHFWYIVSLVCCYLGVMTKEIMVAVPPLVLLYDRTFVTSYFGHALRRRSFYYAVLFCSWGVLLSILGTRGDTMVKVVGGVTWQEYALSQFPALVHYLVLSIWPDTLVFNYGPAWVQNPWSVLPEILTILLLMVLTLVSLRKAPTVQCNWPALAFLGCWFFLILAPTSSIIPVKDPLFEHRMYLPLAAVMLGLILLVYRFLGTRGLVIITLIAAPLFMARTHLRNEDYRSAMAMWTECVVHRPGNLHARNNLGLALAQVGQFPEAIAQYRAALALDPKNEDIRCNLGVALTAAGHMPEAIEEYQQALVLNPKSAHAVCNWGTALAQQGKLEEAIDLFEKAAQLDPHYPEPENNLGVILDQQGKMSEAIVHFLEAVRIDPDYIDGRINLGDALGASGQFAKAAEQYRAVLKLDPDNVSAHYNLGIALVELRQLSDAAAQFREVLRLDPRHPGAHANLGKLSAPP